MKKGLLPRMLPALALVFLAACAGGSDGRQRADTSTVALGGWQRVEPGGASRCARGGRYAFWIRKGDPRRLLVFFQGGGGCFNETTCQPGSVWFDDRVDASDDPGRSGGGILELETPENPFRDYPAVYIPSCTGDVHTGTRVVKYGPYRVQQKGYVNARAALARAFREFPAPDTVFVNGCSAGSVGSAFHSDAIIRRYPGARVTSVGDSLAFARDRRRPPAELGGGLGGRQGRRVSGVPRLS